MPDKSLSKEEWANVYTHGIAIPFCLWGGYLLLSDPSELINTKVYYGLLIYCFSLTSVYTISTLYHWQLDPRKKYLLRIADHIAIYFLIAGTHTPFLLLFLPTTYGMCCLAVLWIFVLFGIFFKIFFVGRFESFSIFLYTAMGWSAILTLPYIWPSLPKNVLLGIVLGGLSYSVGAFVYTKDQVPYNHAIWHLFVIGGSLGHFWALWLCFR